MQPMFKQLALGHLHQHAAAAWPYEKALKLKFQNLQAARLLASKFECLYIYWQSATCLWHSTKMSPQCLVNLKI